MSEERIAEKAFDLHHGKLQEIANWLESLGCKNIICEEHQITLDGLTGVRVGLVQTDPITCAVQLGFALAGMYWPMAYPKLLTLVNKRWKEETKKAKYLAKTEEVQCHN